VRRVTPLSTLTAGRCFTIAETPPGFEDDGDGRRYRRGLSILQADMVWKVRGTEGDRVSAENARGEVEELPPTTAVVEVPRQGYDRLVARFRAEAGE